MKQAPEYDDEIGIAVYTSDADGVGGYLRDHYTDFKVREIEDIDLEPLDADSDDYPYLIIRVTLKNWDTNQFARELSNKLGI
ncbi:MAG: tRNA pseudouridine(13) synthase TruD, partial [Halobacteriaceae archaeon]